MVPMDSIFPFKTPILEREILNDFIFEITFYDENYEKMYSIFS